MSVAAKGDVPAEFALEQNYPNPFNPSTHIRFAIPTSGFVELKIFDLLGKGVATLVNERMVAGAHTAKLDAVGLATGVYLYRLTAGKFSQTMKMVVMR